MFLNPQHVKLQRRLSQQRPGLNISEGCCCPTASNAPFYNNETGVKSRGLTNVLCISQDKLLQCSEYSVSIWRI